MKIQLDIGCTERGLQMNWSVLSCPLEVYIVYIVLCNVMLVLSGFSPAPKAASSLSMQQMPLTGSDVFKFTVACATTKVEISL